MAKGIANPLPPLSKIRQTFCYPSPLGRLYNLTTRCSTAIALEESGYVNSNGYRIVTIDGTQYLAHRIVYAMRHGIEIPTNFDVDHIDGNPSNNRIENLRLATRSENMSNRGKQLDNTSGYKGVSWCNRHKRWKALISKDGNKIFLGYYDSALEAAAFYDAAAIKFHGKFARHNNTGIDRSKELEAYLSNPLMTRNKSGYRGVSWKMRYKKWKAQIFHNSKHFFLGYYVTKEDAARSYNAAAKELLGEFARLNVIPETPRLGRPLGEQLTLFDLPKEKAQTWGMGFLSNTY